MTVRRIEIWDLPGVVGLQKACFPPPFPDELLWQSAHLVRHLELFPLGQFVVEEDDRIVASASNTRIGDERYQAHCNWEKTVGGPFLESFDPAGSTLYGLDISVHPDFRGMGLGRALYEKRFDLVRRMGIERYATGCRLPDFGKWPGDLDSYLEAVSKGEATDRTLTPLLRYGLTLVRGLTDYMEDEESRNSAALLEWTP